jgi:hypothetical protein
MTKKSICENNKSFAYFSGWGGIEFKYIEYGIEDYIYCISNAWHSPKKYHKCKIYSNNNGDMYIKINGIRIYLNECIKI